MNSFVSNWPKKVSGGKSPQVAAVVATFNGEKFIREQLDSILAQTRPPDLVVVSDDGSTDDTLRICEEMSAGARVPMSIVRRPSGLPRGSAAFDRITSNFVRGIGAAADADLYACSDQDDVWCSDRIERSLEGLRRAPSASFVFGDGELIDERGSRLGGLLSEHFPWPTGWNALTPAQQLRFAIRQPFATGATMLMTAKLVRAALPVPRGWLLDRWVSIIGTALAGSRAVSGSVIQYRLHGAQHIGIEGSSTNQARLTEIVARSGSLLAPARKMLDVRSRVRALDVPDDVRAQVGWIEVARLVGHSVRDRP